jgi:hypothetical protein
MGTAHSDNLFAGEIYSEAALDDVAEQLDMQYQRYFCFARRPSAMLAASRSPTTRETSPDASSRSATLPCAAPPRCLLFGSPGVAAPSSGHLVDSPDGTKSAARQDRHFADPSLTRDSGGLDGYAFPPREPKSTEKEEAEEGGKCGEGNWKKKQPASDHHYNGKEEEARRGSETERTGQLLLIDDAPMLLSRNASDDEDDDGSHNCHGRAHRGGGTEVSSRGPNVELVAGDLSFNSTSGSQLGDFWLCSNNYGSLSARKKEGHRRTRSPSVSFIANSDAAAAVSEGHHRSGDGDDYDGCCGPDPSVEKEALFAPPEADEAAAAALLLPVVGASRRPTAAPPKEEESRDELRHQREEDFGREDATNGKKQQQQKKNERSFSITVTDPEQKLLQESVIAMPPAAAGQGPNPTVINAPHTTTHRLPERSAGNPSHHPSASAGGDAASAGRGAAALPRRPFKSWRLSMSGVRDQLADMRSGKEKEEQSVG